MKRRMSMLASFKDVLVGRAMRFVSDPRLTKVASNPRVMNAAMKALSLGGSVKSEIGKATRLAAGVFGIATEEEVATLRSTIQTLEDTVATLEARAAANSANSGATTSSGASAVSASSGATDEPGEGSVPPRPQPDLPAG
jgi:hypothetical protein